MSAPASRKRGPEGDIAQVLAALRARRLYHVRDRIPAYLVIGPAGMGKSTLIQRSGLGCDDAVALPSSRWWLGESAFLVETGVDAAGDGDHPVFAALASLRPAIPISGVVMVVSPADLTLADAGERADMSAAHTRFLRDFATRFGYAPPLYLVASKIDLTPGFAEFFDHLEPAEREQAWGFTLPVPNDRIPDARAGRNAAAPESTLAGRELSAGTTKAGDASPPPKDIAQSYRDGFRRLLDSVRARVTQWISQETNVAQCERIVGFGAQLAALEMILKPIVEPLMPSDKRRWAGVFLRGLYFTSSQQDALSIDTLLPELSKRFVLQRTGTAPPDLGRDDETLGYFVEGLFRRVLLPEAGLAQRNNARSRTRTLRGWLTVVVLLAAFGVLGALCAMSYREGVASIAAVNGAATVVGASFDRAAATTLPDAVTGLDALATLRDPAAAAPPLAIPLAAYARALIAQAGSKLYDRAIATSLAPLLNRQLALALVQVDASSEALRAALAAAERDGGPEAYGRWLRAGGGAGLLPAAEGALQEHAAAARQLGWVPLVDAAYPAFAREVLAARDVAR